MQSGDPYKIQSKRKALTAFFPYVVWREREHDHRVVEAFLSAVKASNSTTSLWHPIMPFISALFQAAGPRTILLTSPHVPWDRGLQETNAVARWADAASAASTASYSKEVEQRVVDTLLHIASFDTLREHIPNDSWSWLNRRPSLPPLCQGRLSAKSKHVVRRVQRLGDPETFTSYLVLVWSEWDPILPRRDLSDMKLAMSRDFRGSGMRSHREQLIRRLEHVLGELDQGVGYLKRFKLWIEEHDVQLAKAQYGELMKTLLEVDRREVEVTVLPT